MKITFTGNDLDKIWKAIKVYKNENFSEEERNQAFDLLLELFSDQLNEAWEVYESEHGATEEDIERNRGTLTEIQWETDELLSRLQN